MEETGKDVGLAIWTAAESVMEQRVQRAGNTFKEYPTVDFEGQDGGTR
jgi:hypothetical protein